MAFFNFGKKQDKTVNSSVTTDEKLYASSRSFQPAGTKCTGGRFVSTGELYDFIAEYLSKPLELHGFKYLKSKKAFRRTTKTGCDEIAIQFKDHVHYHVDFIFGKRIDDLQKIITAVSFENGFNSINNYKEHHTVWVAYSNIIGRKTEIISYTVLESALTMLLPVIENEIIPYFEKLNTPDFLHQTFNYPEKDPGNPFAFWNIQGSDNARITALIIAKWLRSSDYEQLFATYIRQFPTNLILKEKLIKLNAYLNREEQVNI